MLQLVVALAFIASETNLSSDVFTHTGAIPPPQLAVPYVAAHVARATPPADAHSPQSYLQVCKSCVSLSVITFLLYYTTRFAARLAIKTCAAVKSKIRTLLYRARFRTLHALGGALIAGRLRRAPSRKALFSRWRHKTISAHRIMRFRKKRVNFSKSYYYFYRNRVNSLAEYFPCAVATPTTHCPVSPQAFKAALSRPGQTNVGARLCA